MNRRTITILGLLQTGALVFGIFFTALFRRIGLGFGVGPEAGSENKFPLPAPFIMAGRFTHYGVLLAPLIIGWVVWASRTSSGAARSRIPASFVFVSGLILLFVLAFIGIVCSFAATTPMVKL